MKNIFLSNALNALSFLGFGGFASAGIIGYDFNNSSSITGTGSSIIYVAPDSNTLGEVLSIGDFELTDNDNAGQHGRIVSAINGTSLGSTKAAVTSRGTAPSGNAMSFAVDIPEGMSLDLSGLSFDYGFYSSIAIAADNEWVFSVKVGDVTTEVARGGFTHDGGTDYQEPGAAAGNVDLSGFSGLTNTTVTFHWQLNSTATHNFTSRAHTIDNIQLSAELASDPGLPVITTFSVDDKAVPPNTPVAFTWNTSGADTVTLSSVGTVTTNGSTSVQPTTRTTYVLMASNAVGTVQSELEVTLLPDKPNILLMLVDDWGVTDLSVPFAYDRYDDSGTAIITNLNILHKTPHLEALAANGMKFTQNYATPKCSPSRATLMTGFHPTRHGITTHLNLAGTISDGPNNWRYEGLDATDVTVPQMLAPLGYRSIHCGKWHLGGPGDYAQYPTAVGFDVNIAGSQAGQPARYIANASAGYASGTRPMPNMGNYAGTGMYLTKALTIELNKAMANAVDADVPFFGYMSYYGVHRPYTNNPDAVGDYSNAHSANHRTFATMIEAIDVSLGSVVEQLEDLGIAEETLIIHLGDNGSESPVHGNQASIPLGIFSDFPMRGQKNDGYQGGSRVPLIISWAKPDSDNAFQQSLPIVSGGVEHDIVGIVDVVPTILSTAGQTISEDLHGYDLSAYLRGEAGVHRPQKYHLHYPNGGFPTGNLTWYREGDWKLMYNYGANDFLLYDLANDPTESYDVADSEPELVVQMARAMSREIENHWGPLGTIWPIVAGSGSPRPGTEDPFYLSYEAGGRDVVDSDGDGLADIVEDTNRDGLVGVSETDAENWDTDGDQTGDFVELRLNLDPLDRHSFFAVDTQSESEGVIKLEWPSAPGVFFQILSSDDLSEPVGEWQVFLPNVAADGVLDFTSVEIPVDSERKFFSIELLP
ncbi:sulfatase-like hydrolase/transferase [Rubritalea spongiae]|uniref:Sulfatase-like hydrolase/transferase n=1 Tax=Rubritalea spongiae TaxID=430797 RepID=A0ABW5DYA8_9BACT